MSVSPASLIASVINAATLAADESAAVTEMSLPSMLKLNTSPLATSSPTLKVASLKESEDVGSDTERLEIKLVGSCYSNCIRCTWVLYMSYHNL